MKPGLIEAIAKNLDLCAQALSEIRDQMDELIQISLDNESENPGNGTRGKKEQ